MQEKNDIVLFLQLRHEDVFPYGVWQLLWYWSKLSSHQNVISLSAEIWTAMDSFEDQLAEAVKKVLTSVNWNAIF